jgi:spore coat protein JB
MEECFLKENWTDMDTKEGMLPASAPLANPYVPFQRENPPRYDARKGLIRGTMHPGLDLPFMGMVNNRQLTETPLSELQVLGFALHDLALYLDTHRDDKEALEVYQAYQKMYQNARQQYVEVCGPLNHMSPATGEYRWLDDPWPWEYSKNREV